MTKLEKIGNATKAVVFTENFKGTFKYSTITTNNVGGIKRVNFYTKTPWGYQYKNDTGVLLFSSNIKDIRVRKNTVYIADSEQRLKEVLK